MATAKQEKHVLLYTLTALFALCIITYVFAIKKTMLVADNCELLQQQIDSVHFAPQKIVSLEKEIAEFNTQIGQTDSNDFDFQAYLIQTVGNFCEESSMILSKFPTPHDFKKDNLLLQTYRFTVAGTYKQNLLLMKKLESSKHGAKIVAVDMEAKKDIASKKRTLFMTLYIQKIIESNEKE